jgi:hypothetical protein
MRRGFATGTPHFSGRPPRFGPCALPPTSTLSEYHVNRPQSEAVCGEGSGHVPAAPSRTRDRSGRPLLTAAARSFYNARGLSRNVAQKKLDLHKFAASDAAEPSAGSVEIVWCKFAYADLCGELPINLLSKTSFTLLGGGIVSTSPALPSIKIRTTDWERHYR